MKLPFIPRLKLLVSSCRIIDLTKKGVIKSAIKPILSQLISLRGLLFLLLNQIIHFRKQFAGHVSLSLHLG